MRIDGKILEVITTRIEGELTIFLPKPYTDSSTFVEMMIGPLDNIIRSTLEEKLAKGIAERDKVSLETYRGLDGEAWEVFSTSMRKPGPSTRWEEFAKEEPVGEEIKGEIKRARWRLLKAEEDLRKGIQQSAKFLLRNIEP